MPVDKIEIKPEMFTEVQWREVYYTSTLFATDDIQQAYPIKRTVKQITEAARECRIKADEVRMGLEVWADNLDAAAGVLENILEGETK